MSALTSLMFVLLLMVILQLLVYCRTIHPINPQLVEVMMAPPTTPPVKSMAVPPAEAMMAPPVILEPRPVRNVC